MSKYTDFSDFLQEVVDQVVKESPLRQTGKTNYLFKAGWTSFLAATCVAGRNENIGVSDEYDISMAAKRIGVKYKNQFEAHKGEQRYIEGLMDEVKDELKKQLNINTIMSFNFDNREYISLQAFSSKTHEELNENNKGIQFAHPVDGALMKMLDSKPVKGAINKIVELFVSQQSGIMLSTGIPVNPFNYPKIYDSLVSCCNTLGISVPQTVVSPSLSGINAMAIGTFDFSFIAISDLAQTLLPEDQLKFIIGHECGHVALEHVVYHTIGRYLGSLGSLIPAVGPLLAEIVTFPLNTWSRYSEVSADRAGFLCCGDLKVAQRALIRLSGGFSDTNNIDIDMYIEQSKQSLEEHKVGAINEYFMKHPLIPKRLKALELFAKSEKYYRIINKPFSSNDDLLSDKVLNDMVNDVIKVL